MQLVYYQIFCLNVTFLVDYDRAPANVIFFMFLLGATLERLGGAL